MAEPLVLVDGLSYSHGRGAHAQQVLDDVSIQILPGERVVLTGPSGSGKSTLLTIVGGLRSAQTGTVEVLGTSLVGARERTLTRLRRRIGFIFQQHNLAPALSVAQNIQMGLQLTGTGSRRDATERISRAAERVGLGDHLRKLPGQLSGGQQQRAGIARALVSDPPLVLADEPTASLDRRSGEMVMQLFEELTSSGSAVVLVTHDKRVIDEADRLLVLEDGRLVPPADQYLRDASGSLQKLQSVDPQRLGRLMGFGHALAQVALADGAVGAEERATMLESLSARKIFSGAELSLIVDLALAQAQASTEMSSSDRAALEQALKAVAMADDTVTEEERGVIRRLLDNPSHPEVQVPE